MNQHYNVMADSHDLVETHILPDDALDIANGDMGDGQDPNVCSIDAADLLLRVHAFVRRFICYPSEEASIAHVLWIAHTHLMDAWFATPRLAVLSPEPGSGKSRVLEITSLLVPRPILSVGSSAAYILRMISDQENRPTILYDEIDTVFGPAAKGNEDLRGMINSGYRRGATTGRCFSEKGKVYTQELPTYGAIAMSGLGNLPDTIMSRSIIIRMRKRAGHEKVEPFRPQHHDGLGMAMRDELAHWAASVASRAGTMDPIMPAGITDRNADIWGPLFVVAELAGGVWPDWVQTAAIAFVQAAKANVRPSLGALLLTDIHACFGHADRQSTQCLLECLLADEEAPWGDIRGKKLNARELAKMLREFGITSATIRLPDGTTPKGYLRHAFQDAWKRYLPSAPVTAATSATNATATGNQQISVDSGVAGQDASTSCGGRGGNIAEPESQ